MRQAFHRFLLWLHEDLSLCHECLHGYVCGQRLYLRKRAGLPARPHVNGEDSLWL